MSRTLNRFVDSVFFSYRGASRDDEARLVQLEDNLTKALINTMRYGGPLVEKTIFGALGIPWVEELSYEMQAEFPTGLCLDRRPRRYLVGLIPPQATVGEHKESRAQTADGSRRPDAWIWGSDTALCLEAKLVGPLDPGQWRDLEQHYVGRDGACVERIEKTWADLYRAMSSLRSTMTDQGSVSYFMVDQFVTYLELTRMSGFIGLKQEVFDYFHNPTEEYTRIWVRDTFAELASMIEARVKRELDSFYEYCNVGNLKSRDRSVWAAYGAKAFGELAHQTVALGAQNMLVFVNVELDSAVRLLRRALRADPTGLARLLTALPAAHGYEVIISRRRQLLNEAGKPLPRQFDEDPRLQIAYETLVDPATGPIALKLLETTIEKTHLPCISIRCYIDARRAVELSQGDGSALVDEIVARMKALHPFVEWINHGGKQLPGSS